MAIRYWANRVGEGGVYIPDAKKGKYIAIGWELGDLTWVTETCQSKCLTISGCGNT